MARKKKLGVGAKCSCYTTYLHPANTFSERYVNQLYKHETKNILCISKEQKIVHRVKIVCVVFRHDDFEDTELCACLRWCKVNEEGAEAGMFK